ncbi:uncharacterized protein METZ01_LOCUS491690, partial [marine metagenome]
ILTRWRESFLSHHFEDHGSVSQTRVECATVSDIRPREVSEGEAFGVAGRDSSLGRPIRTRHTQASSSSSGEL